MIFKALNFLNLIDNENNLSLTNLSLYMCLVKIPFSNSFADMAIILPAIALYAHKKILKQKANTISDETSKMLKLQESVDSLQKQVENNKQLFSLVEQQSNEAKRILAGAQNSNLFVPRKDR